MQMNQNQVSWLESQLNRQVYSSKVHIQAARKDNDWLHVPIFLDLRDAYKKAQIFQEIENEWEKQQVTPGTHLLLIPAAP